ncbi:hypothetical protein [Thermococcus gorgonarius]|nr:hypothetical protein [Thermococcus gorgonarius]
MAEEMTKRGDYLKAGELLIGAYAYKESGILMSLEKALSFLEMRFPEMRDILEPFKTGRKEDIRKSLEQLFEAMKG